VAYRHVPATTRTVTRRIVIRPARVTWRREVDHRGRVTMCKVVVPAKTKLVKRTVRIGSRTIAHEVPAKYKQVVQPVLLQPARNHNVYVPPVHAYVSEPIVIRPPTATVIQHPPVVRYAYDRVLVQRGGHAWVPVGSRRW
jgi:hypothetical protein